MHQNWYNSITYRLSTVEIFKRLTLKMVCEIRTSGSVMGIDHISIRMCIPVGYGLLQLAYRDRERERNVFLTTHSTHFIYGYMESDIWLRTILIVRKETRCRHIGYSYWLTARVLLYAPSHRQDNTYHSLCYTSRGALAGMRNSSMGGISKTFFKM